MRSFVVQLAASVWHSPILGEGCAYTVDGLLGKWSYLHRHLKLCVVNRLIEGGNSEGSILNPVYVSNRRLFKEGRVTHYF